MRISDLRLPVATCSYILVVVLINALFVYLPESHFMGQAFSIADIAVGSVYVMRDFAQREIGHRVIFAMGFAAILSYFLADRTVALASFTAFAIAEVIDWAIFTFTKRPLSKRLLWSSSMSSPIDSFVFLWMISRVSWLEWSLMTSMKIIGVLWVWSYWRIQALRTRALC